MTNHIRVIDSNGRWLSQMDKYENGSLRMRGEYVGDFDDHRHMPRQVLANLNLPRGQIL